MVVVSGRPDHVLTLHPQLTLVSIPGAGLGYRVVPGGHISAGEVLLTEGSFCAGAAGGSSDEAAVTQFIKVVQTWDRLHEFSHGKLSLESLTTAQGKDDVAGVGTTRASSDAWSSSPQQSSSTTTTTLSRAWVQQCLNNNMYQCRREPRYVALFVALSRFNHSCHPNALNDASVELAHVRAIRPIGPGEQVTISYVPVGHDLTRRRAALATFGFTCECSRCVRERLADPACGTPCEDCGVGMRTMVLHTNESDSDADGNDPFSAARTISPCHVCGSSIGLDSTDVEERHAAVVAASEALRQHGYTHSGHTVSSQRLQRTAETALLLAPFTTHPATLQLHRGLVRLLEQEHRRTKSRDSQGSLLREQLREIKRLEQAHGGASHRDIHFLCCFARLVKQCRCRGSVSKSCCDGGTQNSGDDNDDEFVLMSKHIERRWTKLCRVHFGMNMAPDSFMTDTDDDEILVQYVPIGCGGERLALFDRDDEIDLSGHEIADEGCDMLCRHLGEVSPLRSIDLDSNRLSSVGGIALGAALANGAAPLLTHLDLMCNTIGDAGTCALAAAIQSQSCPLLAYLDLHANDIGDEGCIALGKAFAAGGSAQLLHVNLSANGIDDRGCAALSSLFSRIGGQGMLAHLDLSENIIQNCSPLFVASIEEESEESELTSSLQHINLSWNCITDFEALQAVFSSARNFTALINLRLEGNSLSDREINRFCANIKASGATPILEYEESDADSPGASCEDETRLQKCLQSLADGETINPIVCTDGIWLNKGSAATPLCAEPTPPTRDSAAIRQPPHDCLERDGYFVVPRLFPQWSASGVDDGQHSMEALASTIDRLDLAGWPPVFCFMCDAVWDLIATSLWDEMRLLLGDDCVLEPSFFAWSLKPATTSEGQIGQSFGLPHRDYPASEAMFDDDKTPKLLNVWIPVNDATLENGCMYILPKEFDANFARPEDHAHMRSATAVKRTGVCKLRFPVNGARAVPAEAGSLLSWCGNTIHWGASCSQHAASPPRKSIAMTFRRRSVAQLEGAGEPITQESARSMSPNMRLALIARSLLLYNRWHTLNSSAIPSVIYDVTRT